MHIKESEIKNICSATIYKRGMEYYKEGRVHIKTRHPNEFTAMVDGNERYGIHIRFENDKIADTICTCPYYKTMGCACKHIVAALQMRRAELENSESFENENDCLAAALCKEFEAYETELYRIGLILRITPRRGKISYGASLKLMCGGAEFALNATEQFIAALCHGDDYLIARNKLFQTKKSKFDDASEKIIKVLKQAFESCEDDELYMPSNGELSVGQTAAAELLSVCEAVDTEYIIDGSHYKNPMNFHSNPDILLDVTATDKGITVSLTENGLALISDGSVFFYEDRIFHTTEEWRQWFMPFYRAMISVHRTQLEFVGKNGIEFAAKVLPNIKSKQGVICYNTDELIVREKPEFEIYIDTYKSGISATVKVLYGNISISLPENLVKTDKILVRDEDSERDVMSYFSKFFISGGRYILTDDDEIFDFISNKLPQLSQTAKIFASESFDTIAATPMPSVEAHIAYNEKIDLLEFSADSTLSETELARILEAYSGEKAYYRLNNGVFLNLANEKEKLELLAEIGQISGGALKGKHRIAKLHALYLATAAAEDKIKADKSFSDMISAAMNARAEIPDYLNNVLRDYQKNGVHWMKQLSHLGLGGILADDMGLGKTLQVIAFVMSEKPTLPVLIAVPSALTYNWRNEIEKFAPKARTVIVDGVKEERTELLKNMGEYDFVITSYTLLKRDIEEYESMKFSYFFIDEAQHIKNARTKNARAVKKINAGRYFALTGTPIENSLAELWSVFDFVMHGYLPPYAEFSNRYEKGGKYALEELRRRVKPFILRRMKKDVLSELPEKIENTIYADFEEEQKDIYTAFLKAAKNEIDEMGESGQSTVRILSLLTRLRQLCCHPRLINPSYKKESGKLTLLKELVTSATVSGHRILIFSQFTSMLNIISEALKQEGISCFYLDGSTPGFERAAMAERFNAGEGNVFLISLKAGGTGLNLIGADTVIHYDPWWNPAVTDQASDRAYRIGQTKAVQVIKLVTSNSIEEQILKLSERKRTLADTVIKENASLLSSVSKKELLSLFE